MLIGTEASLRRNRDYVLMWAGQAVPELGSQVSTVAHPLLVLALTHSPAKAGVVGLAATLPLPLLALPAGMLADRAADCPDRGPRSAPQLASRGSAQHTRSRAHAGPRPRRGGHAVAVAAE